MRISTIAFIITMALIGCQKDDAPFDTRDITYNFLDGKTGWTAVFSDYPKGEEAFYELEYDWVKLPEPLDTNIMAIKLSGNNHSDDLFTYMYIPVNGLAPNVTYQASFIILLASNVATNSIGIGGSPDIAIGAGGLDTIPGNLLDVSNYYRPSFKVDLQSGKSNEVMQVLGTLGVSDTTTVYTAINRHNLAKPMDLKTNGDGKLYLLVGWDSGFEGKTTIYIKSISVKLEYWKK
jgi:hypothetical protein